MQVNTEIDALIGQYQHESHRPRADQALHALRKIASIVKPIMRRRNWQVGILAEFFPDEENLLGLNTNRGQKINLRLRYKRDESAFLPLEQVVDTMLHELCHNEIGPHNQQFHALWDQLRDEHEALVRKGYTGEGFLGRGDRLGGQRIPLHEARRRARAAAEQRRVLTAGSGQRLGGTGILRGQDARAVIVAAVDRRSRVERGCASGTDAGRKIAENEAIKKEKVTTTQADRDDENEAVMMQAYIDLIQEEESAKFGENYVPPSAENPAGPRSLPPSTDSKSRSLIEQQKTIEQELSRQRNPPSFVQQQPPSQQPELNQPPPFPVPTSQPLSIPLDTWTCEICTLINPLNFLTCDACGVERPFIPEQSPSPPPPPSSHQLSTKSTKPNPTKNTKGPQTTKEKPNALKPRLSSAQAYSKFETERLQKVATKPVGWSCGRCGNFMESEWWTCSQCGNMKTSS